MRELPVAALILCLALAAPVALAQPCEGNNHLDDRYDDPWSMGGPMVSIEWVPQADVTVTRIEIFTGEVVGDNALAIWSDDGGSPGLPLALLGYTSDFPVDLTNEWRGADLTSPVSVTAGVKYWLLWDPSSGEQLSGTDDPAGIQQYYYGCSSGDVQAGCAGGWSGPFLDHRWKFRMFCRAASTEVAVDVKPGSCPNPVNCRSRGVVPVAVAGTADLDVRDIDPWSVQLAGVDPLRWGYADVATPHDPFTGRDGCGDCTRARGDGVLDLILKFDTRAVTDALAGAADRECAVVPLSGVLFDGTPIVGEDVVRFQCGPGAPDPGPLP